MFRQLIFNHAQSFRAGQQIEKALGIGGLGVLRYSGLLEERTKRGGWKAEWSDGVMVGPILNSDDVPDDKKPGLEVDLFVKSARAETAIFEWPTPEVKARNVRSAERRRTRQNRRRQ